MLFKLHAAPDRALAPALASVPLMLLPLGIILPVPLLLLLLLLRLLQFMLSQSPCHH